MARRHPLSRRSVWAILVLSFLAAASCDSEGCESVAIGSQIRIVTTLDGASSACLGAACGPLVEGELILFDPIALDVANPDEITIIDNRRARTESVSILDADNEPIVQTDELDLPQVTPFGDECGSYAIFGTITVRGTHDIEITPDLREQPDSYVDPPRSE